MSNTPNLVIERLKENEEIPYSLLYLADESAEAIEDYIHRGTCYIAKLNDEVIGEYVLLPTRPFTIELVSVAIKEEYQNKGFGKQLVKHAIETARKSPYKTMEVGTGDAGIGQLALYQKCGFSMCGIDIDFFTKYYDKSFSENGIECRHMVRLKIDFV